jgi:hypothetical protein
MSCALIVSIFLVLVKTVLISLTVEASLAMELVNEYETYIG